MTLASTPDNRDAALQGRDDTLPVGTRIVPGSVVTWPIDTDLIYLPGSKKVKLTMQMPLVRMVVQDAFENLRASLLFEDAFPDPNVTILFVRKNLIGAARSHLPRVEDIHKRLLCDNEYLNNLSPLVSGLPSTII
jgi:hypothetical protein